MSSPRRLVVNADDYGYFRAVSQGVLDCIDAGSVTATGVMANGPALEAMAGPLRERVASGLADAGAHLVLTYGPALHEGMRRRYPRGFPGKGGLVRDLLRGELTLAMIRDEWRAQLDRLRGLGLAPVFCNGHEHVHLLPGLWNVTRDLAREEGVAFVRVPGGPSVPGPGRGKALVVRAMALANDTSGLRPQPALAGGEASGRFSLDFFRRLLQVLPEGATVDCMCHPGRDDPAEMADPRLRAFHDWAGERAALLDPRFHDLARQHGCRLCRFSDLPA